MVGLLEMRAVHARGHQEGPSSFPFSRGPALSLNAWTFRERQAILHPRTDARPFPGWRASRRLDVLLEITPIERANDIHYIVGRVEERRSRSW